MRSIDLEVEKRNMILKNCVVAIISAIILITFAASHRFWGNSIGVPPEALTNFKTEISVRVPGVTISILPSQ